ncbi:MAG: sigma-54-dependent transcriptional regulator [Fibrobacterota bacterium]
MSLPRILIVDDDIHMRSSVAEFLRFSQSYTIEEANNGKEALSRISKESFSVVVSDIKMPEMDGITLLENLQKKEIRTPFIVMSAYGDIQTAVKAMDKGAFYFIEKGTASFTDELEAIVQRALDTDTLIKENRKLNRENTNLRTALREQWNYIGETRKITQIRSLSESIAQSRSTILITGESGTGKELIAKSIHAMSDRSGGPFIKINCAALPENLIESELFGHEKGAFTGALKTRSGKFELAAKGTILLDEIGEMPVTVQAKLLRVLQEREVDKVGGDTPVDVDVRVIATTNRNLEDEIAAGTFREDLYYRLNVFNIELPPLRERKEDIPALADHFIEKYNRENGFTVENLSDKALDALLRHTWPGNIRELENTIERAVVLTRNGAIVPQSLLLNRGREKENQGLTAGMTVAQAERELIFKTLDFCGNNKTKTADMLDISVRTLRNKLNEYEDSHGKEE